MDKTVDAGDNLCECAECCETNDFCFDNCSFGIVLLKDFPGIVLVFSVAERDLLVFSVKSLDENVNFLTDLHNFCGVLDALP